MIAGVSGHLISQSYIEQTLPTVDHEQIARLAPKLVRWWRVASGQLGPASSARAIADIALTPLLQLLGHERPAFAPQAPGLAASLASTRCVAIAVPWEVSGRRAWRDGLRTATAAAAEWALISNGRTLRIVDCQRAWGRASLDFDMERLMVDPRGIAALMLLAGAAVVGGTRQGSLRAHVERSDRHASAVCRSLSDGVLTALPRLADALGRGRAARRISAFDQALTLVYRILFLLFAEARGLVPVWNDVYRDAYTIDALTSRASRSAPGLWRGMQAISRLAHAGCHAGTLSVTAFNGRLFSPQLAPSIEHSAVPDTVIRDVLLSLATESTKGGRRRISYHDLGVEQLGSVYERVLEYEPARQHASFDLQPTSIRRKSTGSFYTPRPLTEFLVRRTLMPLVRDQPPEAILSLRVVDPAMGSGAFLVAACRYLAECYEQAMIDQGAWRAAEVSAADRATARRLIAERCLYGVDLNPTAVQLARLSLWLTTLAADRPLTFLDHHVATGNSLIGAWLSDLAYPPRGRGRPGVALPLLDGLIADDMAVRLLPMRLQMAMVPSDSLDAVKDKERWLAQLSDDGPLSRWTAAADAWCGAALAAGAPADGVVHEWIAMATGAPTTLSPAALRPSFEAARASAAEHSALHWELAFPEVFFDADGRPSANGGFDAVIGNPPWDVMRADLGSTSQRRVARAHTTAALRFCRQSRGYHHQGNGHANSYQLFLERALRITKRGGRIGLLLPSGIAADRGSAALRRHLFDQTTIDTWLGFDNRRAIFPIHRSIRFVLLTTTRRGSTDCLRFRCGLTDPEQLHPGHLDAGMTTVSRSRIEAWDPEHLSIPEVVHPTALAILTSIADRIPPLGDVNGWHARFGRELNASDDRAHFRPRTAKQLPIIEGKHLAPFQVAIDRSQLGISTATAASLLDASATFERPRVAYRDVASATNRLTLIAAMLPAGAVSTHTVFCLKTALDERSQWCLLALINSLVANYLIRLRVTTHVSASLMARLPVPRPAAGSRPFKRLIALARELSKTGVTDDSEPYAELNAVAALLYGITPDQYGFILDTFPLIPKSQRDRCLAAFLRATMPHDTG